MPSHLNVTYAQPGSPITSTFALRHHAVPREDSVQMQYDAKPLVSFLDTLRKTLGLDGVNIPNPAIFNTSWDPISSRKSHQPSIYVSTYLDSIRLWLYPSSRTNREYPNLSGGVWSYKCRGCSRGAWHRRGRW